MKTLIQKDTHTQIFTAALFIITKIQKQPQYPSRDEWIHKVCYTHTHRNITHLSKRIQPFATTWIDLRKYYAWCNKDKYSTLVLICEF